MNRLTTGLLLLALTFSTVAHIFEQKSIHALRETLQYSLTVMNKQDAALKKQSEAIESCRVALHGADVIIRDATVKIAQCAAN